MMARFLFLTVLAMALCMGANCGTPVDSGGGNDVVDDGSSDGGSNDGGNVDDGNIDDGDGSGGAAQPVTPCYSGTFLCESGPGDLSDCGTWQFEIADDDTISGTGQINDFADGVLNVTLSGVFNTLDDVNITINALGADGGAMDLRITAGTLDVTGTWTATDGVEPVGETLSGTTDGGFCAQ